MRFIVVFALALCVPFLASAQEAASAAAGTSFTYTAETGHYRVASEASQAQAEDVAQRMEAALVLYNDVFHFDLARLPAKFRVKVFRDVDSFNAYLSSVLSQERTDFVFVAWSDPERSELLCFPKEEKAFTASLLHQGCIQFVKGFVDNPPIWLREGVATYLDGAAWDAKAGRFTPRTNMAWLDTLKAIVRGESPSRIISFPDLLTLSREKAQSQMEVFAPQSWGLVQFLLNAPDRSWSRVLWDALSSLSTTGTLEENSQLVRKRAFSWRTDQELQQAFQAYVLSLKTAAELVKDGIEQYAKGDLAGAEQALARSLELEPAASTPWYYLGLIAYGRKDYASAEDAYMKAFQLGANAGVINYALGVNSFAAGKNADATKYLNFAKQADKASYGDKVDALLKRIAAGK